MLQIDKQKTLESLKGKISAIYKYLVDENDEENAQKVRQLAQKLHSNEFTIAFCGHFSAGKSKMINCLLDGELLPSSPIPTSANLVRVKTGDDFAKVFFKQDKPRFYMAPYDYSLIKKHCKDGDKIEYVEISHGGLNLPPNVVVMDTPGVDSTDDAHRIATESAIHLADMIFYVMDYNHVQSELNFSFTKELTQAGKELCLVINQIDKHREQEITFTAFQQGVKKSFASWGVYPAHIFYTSMKDREHAHNEFDQLKQFLYKKLAAKDELLLLSIDKALQKIINSHLQLIADKIEKEIQPFNEVLEELSQTQRDKIFSSYEKLSQQKAELADEQQNLNIVFAKEVNKILDNAYLMPFEIRELAKNYLKACEPGFKVGLLFTGKKTQAERQIRLEAFYKAVCEKTQSQIQWHVRTFLFDYLKSKQINDKDLAAKIQNFIIEFSEDLPMAAVKQGARVSDDYVSTYTGNVAAAIKQVTKNQLAALKDEILTTVMQINKLNSEKMTQELAAFEKYIIAVKNMQKKYDEVKTQRSKAETLLQQRYAFENDKYSLFTEEKYDFEIIPAIDMAKKTEQKKNTEAFMPQVNIMSAEKTVKNSDIEIVHTVNKLQSTAKLISDLPGFKNLAGELAHKAQRLNNKGFTVALFGAFSAGKSSFANALIGARVLPVSPNPMTAAINNIKPVNAEHEHKSVEVKLKETAVMLQDINSALKFFELQAKTLFEAVEKIKQIDNTRIDETPQVKTNYSFLNAFSRGYGHFADQMGHIISATVDTFGDYVAVEEKSCFVEWIDLYYDCPLTRQGITLVDTPGADSINARHTGVAFEYIKNADAILFVTYYNHAFSKADREFLIQLGRVKDSFALDKMFFIINAIDLAQDEDEKITVMDYVREQLIKYGIRKPHLSALSSLEALKEKQQPEIAAVSNMSAFEEKFYNFITTDLTQIATTAATNELQRVEKMIGQLIENMQQDEKYKTAKSLEIQQERQSVFAIVEKQDTENSENRFRQERQELLYYVHQRVFLRFNNFFREAFNPAVLKDGQNLKKSLKNALDELLAAIGFDLAQEMRATTIRLDGFINKLLADGQNALRNEVKILNNEITFADFEFKNSDKID